MRGFVWFMRGCRMLWQCSHGKSTREEVDALERLQRSRPKIPHPAAVAFSKTLVGSRDVLKYRRPPRAGRRDVSRGDSPKLKGENT